MIAGEQGKKRVRRRKKGRKIKKEGILWLVVFSDVSFQNITMVMKKIMMKVKAFAMGAKYMA